MWSTAEGAAVSVAGVHRDLIGRSAFVQCQIGSQPVNKVINGVYIMNRRRFAMLTGISVVSLGWGARLSGAETFEVTKSVEDWKKILTPEQFAVLREESTESPWTSALLDEHRKGTFSCAGCDLAAFSSDAKFDSGTGWPSFFDVLPGAVVKKEDNTLFVTRTEVHCTRCGGHFGHLFDDGPKPTGLRFCMNGVALKFVPVAA
jgi:peptide-methionine (R)-S-oxide reductase